MIAPKPFKPIPPQVKSMAVACQGMNLAIMHIYPMLLLFDWFSLFAFAYWSAIVGLYAWISWCIFMTRK